MRRIEDITRELIITEQHMDAAEAENAPEAVIKYFKTLIAKLRTEIDECEVE